MFGGQTADGFVPRLHDGESRPRLFIVQVDDGLPGSAEKPGDSVGGDAGDEAVMAFARVPPPEIRRVQKTELPVVAVLRVGDDALAKFAAEGTRALHQKTDAVCAFFLHGAHCTTSPAGLAFSI